MRTAEILDARVKDIESQGLITGRIKGDEATFAQLFDDVVIRPTAQPYPFQVHFRFDQGNIREFSYITMPKNCSNIASGAA